MKYCIVVPWHNREQLEKFCKAWRIGHETEWLILQQDYNKEGCARTKNKGIKEALRREAEVVIVLDDDCYPNGMKLEEFAQAHLDALEPVEVKLYKAVTNPPSRGTPYHNFSKKLPVAASMGFWNRNPDYDAARTLAGNNTPIYYIDEPMFWRFFPFSGMNCAFRAEFWPFFQFDVSAPRFDDIFMGYQLQAEAYRRGHCINLKGPIVQHVRQSNVWENLKIEAQFMERNETEWQRYI